MKNHVNNQMDRLTILDITQGISELIGADVEAVRADNNESVIQLSHLKWMLQRVEENYEEWPLGKLGRWIGIVMGCVACHGFDISRIQKIVANAKLAYGEGIDMDLQSHLDDDNPFQLDLGGGD